MSRETANNSRGYEPIRAEKGFPFKCLSRQFSAEVLAISIRYVACGRGQSGAAEASRAGWQPTASFVLPPSGPNVRLKCQ